MSVESPTGAASPTGTVSSSGTASPPGTISPSSTLTPSGGTTPASMMSPIASPTKASLAMIYPGVEEGLFSSVVEKPLNVSNKVTIVGAGKVGMAICTSLLAQNTTNEICLVDVCQNKVIAEKMDVMHAAHFLHEPKITSSTEYGITENSRICIITAHVRLDRGETYVSYVQRNVDVLKTIVPKVVKYNPETIIIVAPYGPSVDILTHTTWKLSGFPKNRVFGAGTGLDTSLFRFKLSQRLKVAQACCDAWIIGEEGEKALPVWSGVNIAGVRLRDLNPTVGTDSDKEHWNKLHQEIIFSTNKVSRLKGCTAYSGGLCVARLVAAILNNEGTVHAVSTAVIGEHGIDKEVFLSLPCVITGAGLSSIIKQPLSLLEMDHLQASANRQADVISKLRY